MRESLGHKYIYDHLTRMTTVDDIINASTSKAPWKENKLTLTLIANATQMQKRSPNLRLMVRQGNQAKDLSPSSVSNTDETVLISRNQGECGHSR